ncbi:unnamed protein product [Closterium sp. NIES-53]
MVGGDGAVGEKGERVGKTVRREKRRECRRGALLKFLTPFLRKISSVSLLLFQYGARQAAASSSSAEAANLFLIAAAADFVAPAALTALAAAAMCPPARAALGSRPLPFSTASTDTPSRSSTPSRAAPPTEPRRPLSRTALLSRAAPLSSTALHCPTVTAAPGAGKSALSGTAPTEALHTFTLDSGASRSFFRDSTTLTPLSRPVTVSLADPSRGPVLAHSSTVLPCPAAPSGLVSGLHLPSFSTNLVSGADPQDAWVDQFAPGGQRVTHCTCSRTGRHLATFTRRPGSSLYTLTTAPPPISASGQVAASSQVFAAASRSSPASAPCSCRPLSHETLL